MRLRIRGFPVRSLVRISEQTVALLFHDSTYWHKSRCNGNLKGLKFPFERTIKSNIMSVSVAVILITVDGLFGGGGGLCERPFRSKTIAEGGNSEICHLYQPPEYPQNAPMT